MKRWNNIEVRPKNYIGRQAKPHEIDIVCWYKTDAMEMCYSIASFERDSEGWDLRSYGTRILGDNVNWKDLRKAIKWGFKYLDKLEGEE